MRRSSVRMGRSSDRRSRSLSMHIITLKINKL
jgi:hypothetical protein